MNRRLIPSLVLCLMGVGFGQDARQIVAEVQKRSAASSQHYEGDLKVIDRRGKTSDKKWTYDRIGSHGNSKAIIRFLAPAEVKGVALLIVNHPDSSSDQWMWTPAINRDRRIATQDRRTRFFGTDFSFEDLEERDVDQYNYELKGKEAIEAEPCWKIESRPRESKYSQYTSSILWVREKTFSMARVENYTAGRLIRRLNYRDTAEIQGIWTARQLEVEDFTRNSRTILKMDSLRYNVPFEDGQFTVQALRR